MLVADWNILSSGKMRPFIGVGLGAGYASYKDKPSDVKYKYILGIADPRLGVQFGDHFRVAFDVNLAIERASQKEFRISAPFALIGMKLGWVF